LREESMPALKEWQLMESLLYSTTPSSKDLSS
jgi:hypothetical protein